MKNKKTMLRLFMLLNILSTKIFSADRSCFEKLDTFTRSYTRKGTCVGAISGEESKVSLNKMKIAECIICTGICCCATTGYGAVACVENPLVAYIFGSISGCAGSAALHQAGSLAQRARKAYYESHEPYILPSEIQHHIPSQQIMGFTPYTENANTSRSIRVAQLLQPNAAQSDPMMITIPPHHSIGMPSKAYTSPQANPMENPISCLRMH